MPLDRETITVLLEEAYGERSDERIVSDDTADFSEMLDSRARRRRLWRVDLPAQ